MDFKLDFESRFIKAPDIDMPTTAHLKELAKIPTSRMKKHIQLHGINKALSRDTEYEAFCRWYSRPDKVREPRTAVAFEHKWKLTKGHTNHFKLREGFRDSVYRYFWEWVMDLWPNLVYKQYEKAMDKNSDAAAKFFGEIVSRHLEENKPRQVIQPFMMIGIPQEKLNKLVEPSSMEEVEDIIPQEDKK